MGVESKAEDRRRRSEQPQRSAENKTRGDAPREILSVFTSPEEWWRRTGSEMKKYAQVVHRGAIGAGAAKDPATVWRPSSDTGANSYRTQPLCRSPPLAANLTRHLSHLSACRPLPSASSTASSRQPQHPALFTAFRRQRFGVDLRSASRISILQLTCPAKSVPSAVSRLLGCLPDRFLYRGLRRALRILSRVIKLIFAQSGNLSLRTFSPPSHLTPHNSFATVQFTVQKVNDVQREISSSILFSRCSVSQTILGPGKMTTSMNVSTLQLFGVS